MMNLGKLRLLKYVSSFTDGRVRIRHPALRRSEILQVALEAMRTIHGVQNVEGNVVSGSVLILYDSSIISRDRLMTVGEAWALYLDAVQAGKQANLPEV